MLYNRTGRNHLILTLLSSQKPVINNLTCSFSDIYRTLRYFIIVIYHKTLPNTSVRFGVVKGCGLSETRIKRINYQYGSDTPVSQS